MILKLIEEKIKACDYVIAQYQYRKENYNQYPFGAPHGCCWLSHHSREVMDFIYDCDLHIRHQMLCKQSLTGKLEKYKKLVFEVEHQKEFITSKIENPVDVTFDFLDEEFKKLYSLENNLNYFVKELENKL